MYHAAQQADFLTYLLNEVPTPAFVERMRGNIAEWEQNNRDMPGDMARYLRNTADRPVDDIALELARDWTRLFRGVGAGPGFRLPPPYEACYTGWEGAGASARLFLQLQDIYAKAGLSCAGHGSRPDYIGVMLAFVSLLWRKELAGDIPLENAGNIPLEKAGDIPLEEAGDIPLQKAEYSLLRERFEQDHLQPWVSDFCRRAAPYAETLFFRGVLEELAAFADQRLDGKLEGAGP